MQEAPPNRPPRPAVRVAVVMERRARPNRWEDWAHAVAEVIPDEEAYGTEPRVLRDDGTVQRTLHPGFMLELYADEGKGYYLNLTSGHPVWFVMWRVDEADPSLARPVMVSVSYIEADRWMSAEERVDNVPLPPDLVEWLREFTIANFNPESERRKSRQRPQSFLSPSDRARS